MVDTTSTENPTGAAETVPIKVAVKDLGIYYGAKKAISGINFEIREHEIFGIIGPAGSGKTSFLRALNRMDDFTPSMRVEGEARRPISTSSSSAA